MVVFRQAELGIELTAKRAHRAIADHSQRSPDIHSGHITGLWTSIAIDALVRQPNSGNPSTLQERFADGRSWPNLDCTAAHQFAPNVLQKLAQRQDQPGLLVKERRDVREFHRMVPGEPQGSDHAVAKMDHG
jgi:hypothetical protein